MNSEKTELETTKRLLKQDGYSEEAIEQILKWYCLSEEGETTSF